ncbi:MAG: hypothetical protein KJ674_03225 [Nanoarchaeota archaeon]|nr:hypothetical protein [Nanoarchaeota archaeon]
MKKKTNKKNKEVLKKILPKEVKGKVLFRQRVKEIFPYKPISIGVVVLLVVVLISLFTIYPSQEQTIEGELLTTGLQIGIIIIFIALALLIIFLILKKRKKT